jgi:hypothetical protein
MDNEVVERLSISIIARLTYASRRPALLGVLLTLSLIGSGVAAQKPAGITIGGGVGGGWYCYETTCDAGTIFGLSSSLQLTDAITVEVSGRSHGCFDCNRFLIGDAGILLRYARPRVRPYAGAGIGHSSESDFHESHLGLFAAVGASFPVKDDQWGLRADVRGRRLGTSNWITELTLWLDYRMAGR